MFGLSSRAVGNKAEDLATKYLQKHGYKILDRNYTIRGGEIDLIARHQDQIVFIEVKARYSHDYGLPIESITPFKIKALLKTAQFYLQKIRWGDRAYRFDLVSIDYSLKKDQPEIILMPNFIEL